MKRRKLETPIPHRHRRCTKALSADSHRLLNACALAYWQPPESWEELERRMDENTQKILAEDA